MVKRRGLGKKILILLIIGVVGYFAYTKRDKLKEFWQKTILPLFGKKPTKTPVVTVGTVTQEFIGDEVDAESVPSFQKIEE